MKKQAMLILLIGGLVLAPALGYSNWQGVVQNMQSGSIDWSQRVVQATGIGAPPEKYMGKPQARPMALRAAQVDAYRNLLEITQGVRVNSTTLVKNYVAENDVIMARVEGLVKGAQMVNKEYLSDGTVEVTLQMSLDGGFAQIMLPPDVQDVKPVVPMDTPPAVMPPADMPTPPEAATPDMPDTPAATMPEKTPSDVYTGLVVDARGLNARPAMSPKILDEEGKEVYGSAFVSREYAIQQGMSGYAKQLEAARTNDRVTDNPLTVKGVSTKGPGQCDVVISNADAAMLRSASENLSFMKKCRVMIVVD